MCGRWRRVTSSAIRIAERRYRSPIFAPMLPCLRPAALMLRVFPDQRRASTTQAYEREHVGFAGAKLSQFRSEPQANGKSRIQANANGGLAAFRPGLRGAKRRCGPILGPHRPSSNLKAPETRDRSARLPSATRSQHSKCCSSTRMCPSWSQSMAWSENSRGQHRRLRLD